MSEDEILDTFIEESETETWQERMERLVQENHLATMERLNQLEQLNHQPETTTETEQEAELPQTTELEIIAPVEAQISSSETIQNLPKNESAVDQKVAATQKQKRLARKQARKKK